MPSAPGENVLNSDLRLRVCAALFGVTRSTFADLSQALGISDSSLSKTLRVLEDAEYVTLDKKRVGRTYRTIVALTQTGMDGYARRRDYLRGIID